MISSLYVHFPFCESKCHYCDFYSLGAERTQLSDPDKFEAALLAEATLWSKRDVLAPRLDTLFFGGGTPSMTPPAAMERALAPLNLQSRIDESTEWTMEANPSSITLQNMRDYRQFGINRVSMGVQALRPDLLKDLGRVHSRDSVFTALDSVFEAGFKQVSTDLLCGVPGQGLEDIERALDELCKYPITHLSCYLLTLPPHHRMHKLLPNEETQLEHLLFLHEQMTARGFEHYEISNFAKPEGRARHNLNYWQGNSYLGLGPSAHSFEREGSRRFKNVSSLHKYAALLGEQKLPIEQEEILTLAQQELEKWMLGLRLNEGIPESWLVSPLQKARAKELVQNKMMEVHPTRAQTLRLTARGMALSDQIIAQFV